MHLCREICVARKNELIDLATALLADERVIVRSAAAYTAIWETRLLALSAGPRPDRGAREQAVHEALRVALKRALEAGLEARQAALARKFLTTPSPL